MRLKQSCLLIWGCCLVPESALSESVKDVETSNLELSRRHSSIGGPHQHRRLFLNAILEFFFALLSSNFKTCRQVGGSFEQREGLDLFTYLIAVTVGGETSGLCPVGNGNVEVGQVCNSDDNCKGSGVCRDQVCVASPDCNFLKHTAGDPFDTDRINLIFIGSAFNTHQEFKNAVDKNYDTIQTFEFFNAGITLYNVMYVLPSEGQKSGFCQLPCGGIDRLLCCDLNDSRALSSRCFSSSTNVQTLVVHNNVTYGGAGYPTENVATTTINPTGPLVMAHEIGHSLLSFADEYIEGGGTDFYANCDKAGCSKWSDLIGRTIQGYNRVGCVSGLCAGGRYFVGERSFMEQLILPVGAVNARFACCAYLSLTKSTPPYCNKFEFSPGALLSYCRDNDYQGFGKDTYTRSQGRVVDTSTLFSISIPDNGDPIVVTMESLVRRPQPNREIIFFSSLDDAFGRVIVLEYKRFNSNTSTKLFASATTPVHVPLPFTDEDNGLIIPDGFRVDTTFIQIEVEFNMEEIEFATAELVQVN